MRTTRARGRPGSKLRPSTGEELRPVPHLYDNAVAIDGSSCFVPVPKLGNNETTRARGRPGSKLWPSTGAAASYLFGRSPPEVDTSGGLPLSRWRAIGWANAIRLELSVPRVKRR